VSHRLLVLALTTVTVALCAATASVASSGVPSVARGAMLHIELKTTSYAACAAIVNYADGSLLLGTVKHATDGRLSWTLRVARSAPLGHGTWYVRCGLPVVRSGKFLVVNPSRSAG
jgi:hypothetical protein